MSVKLSYPGVYVEEIASAVRTIGQVSTSIAAFAGWARQGPAGRPVRCLSWFDFERTFGGLDGRSYLGYAVSHFFGNGGSQCYIVRTPSAADVTAEAVVDGLEVEATGPGAWANVYQLVTKPRADDTSRFRLDIVVKASGVVTESYANLSLEPFDSRFVTNVIGDESQLVIVTKADVTKKVTAKTVDLAGGVDGPAIGPGDAAFDTALMGDGATTGIYALAKVDQFNLLNVPGYTATANLAKLEKFCRDHRAFLLVDSDKGSTPTSSAMTGAPDSSLTGSDAINAAFYYPWLLAPDPQQQYRIRSFPPGGAIAGVYARTDASRGVWKAPAGTDASLSGVVGVTIPTNDAENGVLNPLAVNCIRKFPVYGAIVWGARTLQGADEIGSEWKYVPVRRTALFIEESLYRGLKWVVFEPNDEPLWAQIRLNVGSFLNDLFRQGAFQGTTPKDAYFVKCDKDTTTQSDINRGVVNVLVGFAPLKPAEFVVIKLQQLAGQLAT
ncbi:phage tail sheath family protein [Caulobacter sp. LjRoot300]|uniref:phage tail sheath family protein n=1 Tax=Caulobacter sp. LjRoot300 TaxID=3342321 RepID=UPI003ECC3713